MSGQSWCIIAVFLFTLQHISLSFDATPPSADFLSPREKRQTDGCKISRQEFFQEQVIANKIWYFTVRCTTNTNLEVLANKTLCRLNGRVNDGKTPRFHCGFFRRCLTNFTVVISVQNISNQWGENCTFKFHYGRLGNLRISSTTLYITSTVFLPSTASLIGQASTTSPFISVAYSVSSLAGKSSSAVRTPQTSQSFPSVYTGIDITSTVQTSRASEPVLTSSLPNSSTVVKLQTSQSFSSIYTGINIPPTIQTNRASEPVLTSSLPIRSTVARSQPSQSFSPTYTGIVTSPSIRNNPGSKPVLMSSSPTKTISTVTSIQASTTSKYLPTVTLSPDRKEMKKLKQDFDFINNVNTSAVKINDKETIDHVLDAAANLISTNLTTADQKEDPGMQAVEVLQNLGNSISRQLDLGNNTSVTFEKVTEDLVFGVAVINTTILQEFTFPSDDLKVTGDEKIDIPNSVFVSDKSYFVGIIFKPYREMRNNTGDLNLGSKVINAAVSPPPSDQLEEPVEMTFEKNIVGPTLEQACSFWIENTTLSGEHGRWSTRQCFKTYENESHIKCACRHFTNFAVLFKVSDEGQSHHEDHSLNLVVITYVGLSLSILGCLLTFVIYAALPNIKSDRASVHKNLVFALGIADVVFLVSVAVEPEGGSCTAAAMVAFFFYLAVFFWMLVEGVYIYLMVTKVFRGNVAKRRRVAYIVGWGSPLIISVVTWVILRHDVASKYHCWLSVETGAIWAFVGPGLAIILTNCIILVAVMRTTWTTFADDKEYGGLKSAMKTFGAVIPILGITWIFGIMAFNDSSIVFEYIFAIVNSIQGALIFILYCIVNNEVRTEIHRRIVVWRTRREISSSSGAGRGQRSTPAISSEKNTTFNRTTSAQATPDLLRHPLWEIKEVPPTEKVEEKHRPSETPDKTSENDFQLGVKEGQDGGQGEEGDEDSGRSSPVELGRDLGDADGHDDDNVHSTHF